MTRRIVATSVGRAWANPDEQNGTIVVETLEGRVELVIGEGLGDRLAMQAARISEEIDAYGTMFDDVEYDEDDEEFEVVMDERSDADPDDEAYLEDDPYPEEDYVPPRRPVRASQMDGAVRETDPRRSERRAFSGVAMGIVVLLLAVFIGLALLRG